MFLAVSAKKGLYTFVLLTKCFNCTFLAHRIKKAMECWCIKNDRGGIVLVACIGYCDHTMFLDPYWE